MWPIVCHACCHIFFQALSSPKASSGQRKKRMWRKSPICINNEEDDPNPSVEMPSKIPSLLTICTVTKRRYKLFAEVLFDVCGWKVASASPKISVALRFLVSNGSAVTQDGQL